MSSVTKKDIFKYAVLPGLRPRFRELFISGFQYVPYFIALVYRAVRLLPENHPYVQPYNMGRFGVRHVIAEAANNIVFNRHNIDQVLLFATILMGVVLVALQLGLLGMSLLFQPVIAAMPANFSEFFITPAPEQDIAHIMLDMVFGVPDIFDSCISTAAVCIDTAGVNITPDRAAVGLDPAFAFAESWAMEPAAFPTPLNQGLHQLFQTYNIGLTVVAVFISIYFIITIVAETAQTGTPFGKRFNKVWAPIRFVVAFGLLIPFSYGYNSSQYIVLYAAKFGSGFATNGWNIFNDTLSASYVGAVSNMLSTPENSAAGTIAQPNLPEIGALLQFMYTAKVCSEAERLSTNNYAGGVADVDFYLVGDPFAAPNHLDVDFGTTYQDLVDFAAGSSQVIIRFGQRNSKAHNRMMGYVKPTCGELTFKLMDPRDPTCTGTPRCAEPGVEAMQRYYWYIMRELWFQVLQGNGAATGFAELTAPFYAQNLVRKSVHYKDQPNAEPHDPALPGAIAAWKIALQDFYKQDVRNAMLNPGASGLGGILGTGGIGALEAMESSNRWDMDPVVRAKGWVGGALWYNRIAEMNGAMTSAILNIPLPTRYPWMMERIYLVKRQYEQNVTMEERFNPTSVSDTATRGLNETEQKTAHVLWEAFDFWQQGDSASTSHTSPSGNAAIDIINAIFGTEGLFDMRRNDNVHPLAKLTGVGRALVEASIRNLGYVAIGGAGGLLAKIVDESVGQGAATLSGFLVTFATITLTAGFILFYIVPFLPFIYFFFAFGGWVKGIFEAMVGAPLWALAHIRIDNNGLAGGAAVSGYFLIFEVFLRPILIVFGLLASISIFSALVSVLNQVFDLVVSNTGGFDIVAELDGGFGAAQIASMRSAIDEFFFTIIYTIIVYLMGMSSFKLVDLIPNNILRWMNQSVATFGDQREDSGASLVGTSTIGAQQTLGSIGGGLKQVAALGGK